MANALGHLVDIHPDATLEHDPKTGALKKISLAGVALGRRLRDKFRGNKYRPAKLKWPHVIYSTPRVRDCRGFTGSGGTLEELRTHQVGEIITDGNKRQYTVHKDGSLRRS